MKNSLIKKTITAATVLMAITSGAAPRFDSPAAPNRESAAGKTSVAKASEVIVKRTPGLPAKRTMSAPPASISKAARPQMKKMIARAESDKNQDVLINEDFSLWTQGSPENPIYIGDLEDFYIDDTYWNINPAKMQDDKMWAGYGTCSAGGMCALAYPGVGGMIQTPMGDYCGELKISLKVKVLDNEYTEDEEEGLMIIAMCCAPWDNPQPLPLSEESPYYADWEFVEKDGEWHEIEWTYVNTYDKDDCFIQISTYSQILIDEIKVTVNNNYIPTPTPLPATDFTFDGFTANWSEAKNATEYLLTCWRDMPTSDIPGNMVCDFEGVNNTDGVINMEDPNFPEGWDFDFNGATPRLLTQADGFEPNALCLNTNGQTITSPSTGGQISDATLRLRFFGEPDEDGYYEGTIGFSGWNGYKWVGLGSLYMDEYFTDEMVDYNGIKEALEYYGGEYFQLRIDVSELEEGSYVAIDKIDITTLPPSEKEYVTNKKVVKGTSYVFTGVDPYSDYYYEVSARNPELGLESAAPVSCTYAFGVSTPKPLAATDVDKTDGSFNANWESTPKAQDYLIDTYLTYTAPEDKEAYPVLVETFKKVDFGYTVEDPYGFDNFEFISLNELCDNPGWVGFLCGVAEHAVGGVGYPGWGFGGEIQTPWLSLANNGGKFNISISACGSDGDYLCVANSAGETYKCELSDNYRLFELEFNQGTDFDFIAFYTQYKENFFIDYVEINQDLKKGDKVLSQRDSYTTSDTSYYIEFPEALEDDFSAAYTVTAVHSEANNTAYSKASEPTFVEFNNTSAESVKASDLISARGARGEIAVSAPVNAKVSILTCNGVKMADFEGSKTVKVAAGMYIVKVDDKVFKLMVK